MAVGVHRACTDGQCNGAAGAPHTAPRSGWMDHRRTCGWVRSAATARWPRSERAERQRTTRKPYNAQLQIVHVTVISSFSSTQAFSFFSKDFLFAAKETANMFFWRCHFARHTLSIRKPPLPLRCHHYQRARPGCKRRRGAAHRFHPSPRGHFTATTAVKQLLAFARATVRPPERWVRRGEETVVEEALGWGGSSVVVD